jgi:hypothetical protein
MAEQGEDTAPETRGWLLPKLVAAPGVQPGGLGLPRTWGGKRFRHQLQDDLKGLQLPLQLWQTWQQATISQAGNAPDVKTVTLGRSNVANSLSQEIECLCDLGMKCLPRWRERQSTPLRFNQVDAKITLQIVQVPGYNGWADREFFAGSPHAACPPKCLKSFQRTQGRQACHDNQTDSDNSRAFGICVTKPMISGTNTSHRYCIILADPSNCLAAWPPVSRSWSASGDSNGGV